MKFYFYKSWNEDIRRVHILPDLYIEFGKSVNTHVKFSWLMMEMSFAWTR